MLIGHFSEYRGFTGSIEIINPKQYKSVIEHNNTVVMENNKPLECISIPKNDAIYDLYETFKKTIDDYISRHENDSTCNKELKNNCSLNCKECICKDCDKNTFCNGGNPATGCEG